MRLNERPLSLARLPQESVHAAEFYNDVVAKIDAQLMKLSQIMKTDVPAFNQAVKDQNIPAIVVKPPSP